MKSALAFAAAVALLAGCYVYDDPYYYGVPTTSAYVVTAPGDVSRYPYYYYQGGVVYSAPGGRYYYHHGPYWYRYPYAPYYRHAVPHYYYPHYYRHYP
jgi:hypothetical protein